MKIVCPICHVQGILEVRGQSQRVVHYQYVYGKRIFSRHKIVGTIGYSMGTMGTELGTEKTGNSIFNRNMVGLERFELSSITPEATSLDQASRQPQQFGLVFRGFIE